MSTHDDSAALAEIKELVSFVNHSNPQVRFQASKMVTALSALDSNRALIAQTDLISAMAKQMTAAKEISREIFKAIINFGEAEELCQKKRKTTIDEANARRNEVIRCVALHCIAFTCVSCCLTCACICMLDPFVWCYLCLLRSTNVEA